MPAETIASRLQVDLRKPDMLLATRNLAKLPKDIVAVPLLAGIVDQQLVFHYEEDEARLSIEGSLRRLAYEHQLAIEDRFRSALLAAPAEIGFWRSAKGRPEHFVARLERGVLGRLAEAFARIALNDEQLRQAGKFRLGSGEVTLYTPSYGGGRTLAFAGRGDRWVFLSSPDLAFDAAGELTVDARLVLGELLDGRHPWQAQLPPAAAAQHSLVIGGQALSMDYRRFLPAIAGLRFDYQDASWRASLRIEQRQAASYDTATIWRAVPLGAAFCTALPVHWPAAGAALEGLLGKNPAIQGTLAALDPIAAVCWYADSRFAAPLFIARAAGELPAEAGPLLAELAEKSWSAGSSASNPDDGRGQLHVASVASRHGIRSPDDGERRFEVALARHEGWLFFSPDRRQVEAALDVAAKRAAALGDEQGLRGQAWLVLDPPLLARLLRSEVQEALPANEESLFREVARDRLWPRLDAWGQQQAATVAVPTDVAADGFVALEIRPLQGSPR